MAAVSRQARYARSSSASVRGGSRPSGLASSTSASYPRASHAGYGHGSYEVYGNTVRQPRYDGSAQPARPERPERERCRERFDERGYRAEGRPEIDVIAGRGGQAQAEPLSSSVVFAAKVFAVVLAVMAVLSCARITFSSAAVTTALETRELSSQIESARSQGNALEVAQSSLSNSARIKDAATLLGMSAPAYVATMDLSGDVVVTDEQGNLSLSGAAAVLAQG